MVGHDKDFVATRVSYKLNLRGPSVAVQTACSTSLVPVQVACQSLLAYQCDMALAGGVGIRVPQATGYLYQEGGISSPDGHCRAFDAEVRGWSAATAWGSSSSSGLVRPCGTATDSRCIRRGSINNDGSVKVGYTAPSVDGQAEVIAMAHAMADMIAGYDHVCRSARHRYAARRPDRDRRANPGFRVGTKRRQFCAIGSVKTNIGHLDTAAGSRWPDQDRTRSPAQAKSRQAYISKRPTRKSILRDSPFYVNTASTPWSSQSGPRRAGLSSFGIGGTNAHVVLEEAPQPGIADIRPDAAPAAVRPLAHGPRRRHPLASDLSRRAPECEISGDFAYTTQIGRRSFGRRRFLVASGAAEAAHMLQIG